MLLPNYRQSQFLLTREPSSQPPYTLSLVTLPVTAPIHPRVRQIPTHHALEATCGFLTAPFQEANITSENYIGLSNACSFHGATETYTVTVASGVFYLNGLANPPIQLLRGHTYIFDQADGTNNGHPFHFKDTG